MSGGDFLRDVIFPRVWCGLPNPSASFFKGAPQHLSVYLMPTIKVVSFQLSNNIICNSSCSLLFNLQLRVFSLGLMMHSTKVVMYSVKVVMYSVKVVMYSAGVGPKSPSDRTFCHQQRI